MGRHSRSDGATGNPNQGSGKHSTRTDHRHVNPRDNDAQKASDAVRLANAANDRAMQDIRNRQLRGE